MKTITVVIGNSDNKLTQREWSEFIQDLTKALYLMVEKVHFLGFSNPTSPWQNACVVAEVDPYWMGSVEQTLKNLAEKYKQESIALIAGETEFIKA